MIEFTDGTPAPEADISALERWVGGRLPRAYVDFVRERDGASASSNRFVSSGGSASVRQFIPVRSIEAESRHIENLERGTFPFGYDDCGNYLLLNAANGAVLFWDHEEPEPVRQLADSFEAFLDGLSPFSVELEPGQVISVRVNPDFLKKLQAENPG